MAKNNGGALAFIVGAVAGAGALFFSKEKNRKNIEGVVKKVGKKAQKAQTDYEKNPQAFKKQAKVDAQRIAKKTIAKAKTKKAAVVRKMADNKKVSVK